MKRLVTTATVVLLFLLCIGTASAGPARGTSGRTEAGHLFLFERDPVDGGIVSDGASGVLSYMVPPDTLTMEPFVFQGNRLAPETDFSLLCFHGSDFLVLGKSKSDQSGRVHIAGHFNFGAIPVATNGNEKGGARVWLVLSKDIGSYQVYNWTPSEYLSS